MFKLLFAHNYVRRVLNIDISCTTESCMHVNRSLQATPASHAPSYPTLTEMASPGLVTLKLSYSFSIGDITPDQLQAVMHDVTTVSW